MNRPSPAQIERARHLLAHERGDVGDLVEASGQVLDKLREHLDSLLGAKGVQALLARSAQLTRGEATPLDVTAVESSSSLRACLRELDPALAAVTATTLFGTFLTLLTGYIGDRLTTQALHRAWPELTLGSSTERHHE